MLNRRSFDRRASTPLQLVLAALPAALLTLSATAEVPRCSSPPVEVPRDEVIYLVSRTPLGTRITHRGDLLEFAVAEEVRGAEGVLLAEGTRVKARVIRTRRPGRLFRRARLVIQFEGILRCGLWHPLPVPPLRLRGGSTLLSSFRGAAPGGLFARALGTIPGVAIAGVGIMSRGVAVRVPAGTRIGVRLSEPLRLD